MAKVKKDEKEEFLLNLKSLLEKGRRNGGVVSEAEVRDAFTEELDDAKFEVVKSYLEENHIGVGKPMGLGELLTEEELKYLDDYEESLKEIEQPEDSVLDAIKLNAMAGEPDSQMQLVTLMLPKVVDLAKTYAGQGVFIEDLIGVGNEALLLAVKLLAPLDGPGDVESALMEHCMREMERLIEEENSAAIEDEEIADRVNRVSDAAGELAKDLGRKVTVGELAAEGELTEEEILEAIRVTANKIEDIDYKG